jgi:hypothetical protein
VSRAAGQRVHIHAADQGILAGAAVQQVAASAAAEQVVAGTAEQQVRAIRIDDPRVAHGADAGGAVAVDRVVARPSEDGVGAEARQDGVVARAARIRLSPGVWPKRGG